MGQTNDHSNNAEDLLRRARSYRIDKDYYETSTDDRGTALELLTRALELSQATGDLATQALCLQDISRIHDMNGDYAAATVWAKQALKAFQELGDAKEEAWAYQKLANLHYVVSDYGNAIEYARHALQCSERLEHADFVANACNMLGACYSELGRDDEAEIAFRRTLKVAPSDGEAAHQLAYLVYFIRHLCSRNRTEEVWELCENLTAIIPGRKPRQKILGYTTLAIACNLVKKFDEAARYCREGIALCEMISDQYSEAALLGPFADACQGLGDNPGARAAYGRILEISKTIGDGIITSDAHRGLAELAEADGDIALALFHFKRYHAIDKARFNAAAAGKIRAMTVEMQLDRAKQEAEIHRIRSVELMELNAALESANNLLHDQNEELEAQANALQAYSRRLEEQQSLLQAQAVELERLATVDLLTGLYNRRYLESWMEREFSQARRYPTELTIALADIDHFKRINDTFGHQVGDEVLKALGTIFTTTCRAGDLIARYGGEEFVFVMAHTNKTDGHAACERVREAVQNHPWQTLHPDLAVTISFGVSSETSLPSYEHLLSDADERLYEAKRSGRNRVA